MTRISRRTLRQHEERVLKGLVDYYYETADQSEAYGDEASGIYEHKLASRLGYKNGPNDQSPIEFLEACRILEASGYVRRLRRKEDFPRFGIWPTVEGLDRAEYMAASLAGKARIHVQRHWVEVMVSAVTTLVVLTILFALGLLGLRG